MTASSPHGKSVPDVTFGRLCLERVETSSRPKLAHDPTMEAVRISILPFALALVVCLERTADACDCISVRSGDTAKVDASD